MRQRLLWKQSICAYKHQHLSLPSWACLQCSVTTITKVLKTLPHCILGLEWLLSFFLDSRYGWNSYRYSTRIKLNNNDGQSRPLVPLNHTTTLIALLVIQNSMLLSWWMGYLNPERTSFPSHHNVKIVSEEDRPWEHFDCFFQKIVFDVSRTFSL